MKKVYDTVKNRYILHGWIKRTSFFIISFGLSYNKNGYSRNFVHYLTFLSITYRIDFAVYKQNYIDILNKTAK